MKLIKDVPKAKQIDKGETKQNYLNLELDSFM